MDSGTIVRGGTVVTPAGTRKLDIVIEGGRIVALAEHAPSGSGADEIDATGLIVLPGGVDGSGESTPRPILDPARLRRFGVLVPAAAHRAREGPGQGGREEDGREEYLGQLTIEERRELEEQERQWREKGS